MIREEEGMKGDERFGQKGFGIAWVLRCIYDMNALLNDEDRESCLRYAFDLRCRSCSYCRIERQVIIASHSEY